jgi:hypothetical protein
MRLSNLKLALAGTSGSALTAGNVSAPFAAGVVGGATPTDGAAGADWFCQARAPATTPPKSTSRPSAAQVLPAPDFFGNAGRAGGETGGETWTGLATGCGGGCAQLRKTAPQ